LVWVENRQPSAAVDLEALRLSGRPYGESLSANTRYQIRRAIKLYAERGPLTIAPAAGVEEGLRFFDELCVLHQRQWAARHQPGALASSFIAQFHRALIRRCLPAGEAEL